MVVPVEKSYRFGFKTRSEAFPMEGADQKTTQDRRIEGQ